MPATEKQIKANRKNAQKSTGPKTKEGKEKVSQNAVKFGLYTKNIIINSPHRQEDPGEYVALVESLHEELKPSGPMQEHLVMVIANAMWRQFRAVAAETACVIDQLDNIDTHFIASYKLRYEDYDLDNEESKAQFRQDIERIVSTRADMNLIPHDDYGRDILRYEMRLDRQISRAYNLLERLQQRQPRQSAPQSTEKVSRPQNPDPTAPSGQSSCPAESPFGDEVLTSSSPETPGRILDDITDLHPALDITPDSSPNDIIIPDHSLSDEEGSKLLGQICAQHNAIVFVDEKVLNKK